MSETITCSAIIPAAPERVYEAWLDAKAHTAMTGAHATDEGNGQFTAWDGYISGRTVSAVPHEKIVQAWRTTEFPDDAPDSMLTITFTADEGGSTRVSLVQENVPDGQGASYRKGWDEFYFGPMQKYFPSTMEKVKDSLENALEEVEEAAAETMKEVKKAQKKAAATLKKVGAQVSKKVKTLLSRSSKPKKTRKKAAPKRAKKVVKVAPRKKAAPKRKKK